MVKVFFSKMINGKWTSISLSREDIREAARECIDINTEIFLKIKEKVSSTPGLSKKQEDDLKEFLHRNSGVKLFSFLDGLASEFAQKENEKSFTKRRDSSASETRREFLEEI